ncbi:MAG: polysaccharide pyruvyl transferase family protein [Acidobacteria bacterium]|nr:polysaccharide pyruvyl transferase family protein [Acidobacteriota bacterium]
MSRRWHLVGAFDRFNYGDLLFPHLVRGVLEQLGKAVEIHCWSTREADLSAHGGVPCGSLAELEACAGPRDAVVLAGGELLAARWTGTIRALTGEGWSLAWGLAARALGATVTDALARRRLGGRRPQPWVLGPGDVGGAAVAYNAVGAQGVRGLPPALRRSLRERLEAARFLAVRDTQSRDALAEWGLDARLSPDPAALVAELFPKEALLERSSPEVRALLAELGDGFAVVQAGRFPSRGLLPALAGELRRLVRTTSLPLLLLPLGLAAGHEDPRPLAALAVELADLSPAPRPVPVTTIWDQAAVISRARLFAGTSLHGNLTAAAYAVPTVGFGARVAKLDAFLEHWLADRPSAAPGCTPVAKLGEEMNRALEEPAAPRRDRARRLAAAGREHARALVGALGPPTP